MPKNGVLIGAVTAAVALALVLTTLGILYATGVFNGKSDDATNTTTMVPSQDKNSSKIRKNLSLFHSNLQFYSNEAWDDNNDSQEEIPTNIRQKEWTDGVDKFYGNDAVCDWSTLDFWKDVSNVDQLVMWDYTADWKRYFRFDVAAAQQLTLHDSPLRVDAQRENIISEQLEILLNEAQIKAIYADNEYIYNAHTSIFTQSLHRSSNLSVVLKDDVGENVVEVVKQLKARRFILDTMYSSDNEDNQKNNDAYFERVKTGVYNFHVGATHAKLQHISQQKNAPMYWRASGNVNNTRIAFDMTATTMRFDSPFANITVSRLNKESDNTFDMSWTGNYKIQLMAPKWAVIAKPSACNNCSLIITTNRNTISKKSQALENAKLGPLTWMLVSAGRINVSAACASLNYEATKGGHLTLESEREIMDAVLNDKSRKFLLKHKDDIITVDEPRHVVKCVANSDSMTVDKDGCSGQNQLASFYYNRKQHTIELKRLIEKGDYGTVRIDIVRQLIDNEINFKQVPNSNTYSKTVRWETPNGLEWIEIDEGTSVRIVYSKLSLTLNVTTAVPSLQSVAVGLVRWRANGALSAYCSAGTAHIRSSGRIELRSRSSDHKKERVKYLHVDQKGAVTVALGDKNSSEFKMHVKRDGRATFSSDSANLKIN